MGTAQALLNIRAKNRTECQFIVISGDTIIDPSFLHGMLDEHLHNQATLTLALKHKPATESDASSQRSVRSGDIIGVDPSGKQLLFIASSDEYVDSSLKIKTSLMDTFHSIKFCYNILDSHVYIFSREAMSILEKQKHTYSIKQEFIPHLLRCQYRPELAASSSSRSGSKTTDHDEYAAERRNAASESDLYGLSGTSKMVKERSSALSDKTSVRCFAYFLKDEQYCSRVNSIASYLVTNRELITGNHFVKPSTAVLRGGISQGAVLGRKTRVTNDCFVHSTAVIGATCQVQNSVIGQYVVIADGAQITNSVLADHVEVGEGAIITNTIISASCVIAKGSSLVDCTVGTSYRTETDSKHTHESLTRNSTTLD